MRPELIKATELLATKDSASIDEAIGLLQETVYSFSMRVCGHPEDAEDNMQEVLYRSLPHLARITEPRALAVWLYTVTRNRCWTTRRKSKFVPEATLTLEDLMPDDAEMASLMADPQATPERSAILREQDHLLQQAILRVPSMYRLILILHDVEDLDTGEIAKITSLREGTVRVRLHRARLFVRREMAGGKAPAARAKSGGRSATAPRGTSCKKMFASLSEYLDGRLDDQACDKMQRHISECAPCVAFLRDLERTTERCQALDTECPPRAAETVRKLLAQEYLRLLDTAGAQVS